MKNIRITAIRLCLLIGISYALTLVSCSFGLESASRARTGSLTVTLSGAANDSATMSGRAVASGSGFLYLQTGLAAQTAKLYGPYPVVPGATVTVTDIPAETYPAIALLFVPEKPGSPLAPIVSAETTLEGTRLAAQAALSAYPDICSASSVGLVENFEIVWGAQNTLSATLVPTTALAQSADGTIALAGSGGVGVRQFVRFSGFGARYAANPANTTMTCNLKNPSPDPVTVSTVRLYDSKGSLVSSGSSALTIAAGGTETVASAWTGDDAYYLYVDFTGAALQVGFPGEVSAIPAVTHTITFNGNGGDGTMANLIVAEGSMVVLPANGFSRINLYFAGWAITSDALEPVYANKASFTMGTADMTLYAVWSETPPLPAASSLTIASGAQYVSTPSVSVSCAIDNVGSGIKTITLSGDVVSLSSPTVTFNGTPLSPITVSGNTITLPTPIGQNGNIEVTGATLSSGDGPKTVFVSMTDSAGQISDAISASVTLDVATPSVTVPSGTLYAKSGGSFTVSGTVSDSSGIAGVSVSFSFADPLSVAATVTGTSYTGTLSLLGGITEGSYTYTVHATDKALHGTDAVGNVYIDNTPPVVDHVTINGGVFTNGQSATMSIGAPYYIEVFCTDASSGVSEVSFNNGLPFQAVMNVSGNAIDGSKTYLIYARDAAGNVSSGGGFTITIYGN